MPVVEEYYDVVVVGAGHAGCEAGLAAARLGLETIIFTVSVDSIAMMPCNPNIGGSSKGHLVREVDALGGEMGKNIDKTFIQSKMLNASKGPAVHSLRAQADKQDYSAQMRRTLENTEHLTVRQGEISEIMVDKGKIKGAKTISGATYYAKAVVLCTGVYLKAKCIYGDVSEHTGPNGLKAANALTESLIANGIEVRRFKTGTPARVDKRSIDFSKMEEQFGDERVIPFSFSTNPETVQKEQVSCWLTYTNENTHNIIRQNLDRSPLFSGAIEGTGPRYCPSIEDKVVRFHEKERHQLFLEPESLYYDDIYLQGFSTSMPHDIQEKMVHSLEGLEHAKILKYAYAIEYDAIYPTQLKQTLETKLVENLYTAGQINGTSGYEEAACQGLMAGINASLKINGKEPLILKRDDAYIGVLIDDLVTKGIRDPYRLLTSRAEYRLLLRHDNADLRLREYGYQVGLISEEQHNKLIEKKQKIEELKQYLEKYKITPTPATNKYLSTIPTANIQDGITLYQFLKRPEIKIEHLEHFYPIPYANEIKEQVSIFIKYEGYILKAQKEAEKMKKLEYKKIPETIDYDKIPNIASEARQKLKEVKPTSIGQALRISGVNPADISILMIYLKKENNHAN